MTIMKRFPISGNRLSEKEARQNKKREKNPDPNRSDFALVHRRALFAAVPGLALAGCTSVVGPPPSPRLYTLQPPLPGRLEGAKVAWALAIRRPDAAADLDSDRIALTRPPADLDYYADAAWADRLPNLAARALQEAFEASQRIAAVARDADGAHADYLLAVELRDFAAHYDTGEGAPLAVVRLAAHVVEARSRRLADGIVIGKQQRASANAVAAAVTALAVAYGAVLAELVPWVLDRSAPA